MALIGVTLRSTDISPTIMEHFNPSNWTPFEHFVLTHLQQRLPGMGITSVKLDILQTPHPGPTAMKFTVESNIAITAQQLKDILRH